MVSLQWSDPKPIIKQPPTSFMKPSGASFFVLMTHSTWRTGARVLGTLQLRDQGLRMGLQARLWQ